MGLGGLYGLFLSLVLVPQLAHHFSYKNLFQSYFDHKKGDEPVGVMGIPGSGPDFYAHGKLTRLESTTQLFAFLKRPERVFAILPRDKLCEVHQQSLTQSVALHVLDRNSRFNLFTNQLAEVSAAGVDGMVFGFLDYNEELKYFDSAVMPLLRHAGLRR